jgi:cytochrome P450
VVADDSDPVRRSVDLTRASPSRVYDYLIGGAHFCLGANLARIEAQTAVHALLHHFREMSLTVPEADLRWRPANTPDWSAGRSTWPRCRGEWE